MDDQLIPYGGISKEMDTQRLEVTMSLGVVTVTKPIKEERLKPSECT